MNKKLNPTDAFFIQVERPAAPMHIGSLSRFQLPQGKGQDYILELVKVTREQPITAAPFNFKLSQSMMGRWAPSWETEDDIDIDYHIRHLALPQPGGERELAILVSRLHSIPLDRARPLWEMHFIEGLADGSFAIYSKMHHSLVDGVAAVKMLNRTFASNPAPDSYVPVWNLPNKPRKREESPDPSGTREAFHGFVEQFGRQLTGIGRVSNSLTRTLRGAKNKDLPHLVAPYSAPDTILNRKIGPQRRVSTLDFALADFKSLAKAAKGTLNDAVMAVCSGALRAYLSELNELPNEPLVAQVPVSVRPQDDPGEGNAISMLLTNLGTHLADPQARFDCVKASLDDGKSLLRRLGKSEIAQYSALLMAPFAIGQIAGIGNRSRKPMFNVVISNVPGPKTPLYLNEAEMLSCHPVSLVFEGQALNITIFTYADKLSFIYTACRRSLPHVQRLVGHAQAAFDELCRSYGVESVGLLGTTKEAAPRSANKKAIPSPRKATAKTTSKSSAKARAARATRSKTTSRAKPSTATKTTTKKATSATRQSRAKKSTGD